MSLDDLLRAYARQDLNRFCQGRNLNDTELAGPLLSAPGLSPRELDAATALDALAKFEALVKRTVEETTSQALDIAEEEAPECGMNFEQMRQIWARREVFRRAALVYARMVGDEQLIEHYQTPEPAPTEAAEPVVSSNVAESAINGPRPLTTGDITFCFDGLHWYEKE